LDAINELIHFDHVYYKPPVSDPPQPLVVEKSVQPPVITIQDSPDSSSMIVEQSSNDAEALVSPSLKLNFNDLDDIAELLHQDLLSTDNGMGAHIPSGQRSLTPEQILGEMDPESMYVSRTEKGLTVPQIRASQSDSGYSDVGSPRSDISSVGSSEEEDMWEESFTELFPSLL